MKKLKITLTLLNGRSWQSQIFNLPEHQRLDELAHNLWWAWDYEARDSFKSLDEALYEEVQHIQSFYLSV